MPNRLLMLGALLLTAACASEPVPTRHPLAYPNVSRPHPPNQPNPPLPAAGYVSPFSVVRFPPIDLSRIVPAAGSGPCAPVEVAPAVWIAPDCSEAMAQRLTSSPNVA